MLKQRKVPMRMCVATHERCEKKDLIRVVKTNEGIIADKTGKVNGHGFYLKKDLDVVDQAKKSKLLNKLFNEEVDDSLYDEIKELIQNG